MELEGHLYCEKSTLRSATKIAVRPLVINAQGQTPPHIHYAHASLLIKIGAPQAKVIYVLPKRGKPPSSVTLAMCRRTPIHWNVSSQ